MEPFAGFISIVGLVCNYLNEKRTQETEEFKDFTTWLSHNNHNEVLNYILENHKLLNSINQLLSVNNEILNDNFEYLDKSLSKIACRLDGFENIVDLIHPNIELSDQAVSILQQFEASNCEYILEHDKISYEYIIIPGSNLLEIKEQRFFKDDLDVLAKLGFIRIDYTPKGKQKIFFTRDGQNYLIKNLSK